MATSISISHTESKMSLLNNILILVIALSFTSALSEECNPQDKKALLQIKSELGNPSNLSSWLPTTDCCNQTWQGVACDSDVRGSRVFILDFSYFKLPKPTPIPSSIANLPYLEYLFIINATNFVGSIPPTIAKLPKLSDIHIIHTNVSGAIPDFLSQIKTLTTIDLSYNNLSGKLPPSLPSLPILNAISFDGNRISGTIPDTYGSFSNQSFQQMTLSRNLLTGKIPATLKELDIAILDLSQNMLEGDPSVLFGAEKYTRKINLANNLFAFDFGKVELPGNLNALDLKRNHMYGTLPKGLTSLKSLHRLNVSFNNLCGEIPQGGNMEMFGVSSYFHNKCLCGSPLPNCN